MSNCQGCLGCGLQTDAQGRLLVHVDPIGGVLCGAEGLTFNLDDSSLQQTGGVLRAPVPRIGFAQAARFSESVGPSHYRMTVDTTVLMSYGAPFDSGGWAAASPSGQPITVPAAAGDGLYDIAASINWAGVEGVGGASLEVMWGLLVVSAAMVPTYVAWVPPTTPPPGVQSYSTMGQKAGLRTTSRFAAIPLVVGDQLRITIVPNNLTVELGDVQVRKVSV